MLPSEVLLEISNFYVDEDIDEKSGPFEESGIAEWINLAHVSRRWRGVVFQSPRRLNLRLLCTSETPARDTLDIWPPLPLIIRCVDNIFDNKPSSMDNIIAALEHNDRVCQIELANLTSSSFRYVMDSAATLKPFPELTDLLLNMSTEVFGSLPKLINLLARVDESADDLPGPILSDSFLGGTAPRLRSLNLNGVPFPGLPKLLLSATQLVYLSLYDIPRSGYIPPEAMATSLSALTSLESLHLRFRYPPPRPGLESRRPPPLTRTILPSLTKIRFKGASEYLEEILAPIAAPRLNRLHITFFNQIIFDTPQLFLFISHSPALKAHEKGHVAFNDKAIIVKFPSQTSDYIVLSVKIPSTASEWQLSSLEQVCTSSLPPVSTLEDLYISENQHWRPRWQDDVENTLWLDLLRPFVSVKNLYLSEEYVPRIAPALQELVGGRTTEVLPTLENIFLRKFQTSGPLHKGVEKFVAARRLTSRPVAVSSWHRVKFWDVYDW
jgi:hypothetical protein